MRLRIYPVVLFLFFISASACAQNTMVPSGDEQAGIKLGISVNDLADINSLIKNESGYYLVKYEKTSVGLIGAWFAPIPKRDTPKGGPVYFYRKYQGKWYRLNEMSAWGDHL